MLPPDAHEVDPENIRPLRRVEYDRLVADGFFHDERVELVFGQVVRMSPIDPAHAESTDRIVTMLHKLLGDRGRIRRQSSFAARDDSEPEPDVLVVPNRDYWREHPSRAFLVIEVARSSLRWDRGTKALLYGLSEVEEYWIVNHVDGVVEVFRDRHDGTWRSRTMYGRSDTIALLAFPDVMISVGEILPPV
jgi:Uma2 family endonuclease